MVRGKGPPAQPPVSCFSIRVPPMFPAPHLAPCSPTEAWAPPYPRAPSLQCSSSVLDARCLPSTQHHRSTARSHSALPAIVRFGGASHGTGRMRKMCQQRPASPRLTPGGLGSSQQEQRHRRPLPQAPGSPGSTPKGAASACLATAALHNIGIMKRSPY